MMVAWEAIAFFFIMIQWDIFFARNVPDSDELYYISGFLFQWVSVCLTFFLYYYLAGHIFFASNVSDSDELYYINGFSFSMGKRLSGCFVE